MSNTFWAVFTGSSLGGLAVAIITSTIEDLRVRKHSKKLREYLDYLDLEDECDEDCECD